MPPREIDIPRPPEHKIDILRPEEHKLPPESHEVFRTLREHELPERWMREHPGQDHASYDRWRQNSPDQFSAWAETQAHEMIVVREQTAIARLEARNVESFENKNTERIWNAFPEGPRNDLFKDLNQITRAADRDGLITGMEVEVRTQASDLGRVAEKVGETAAKTLIEAYAATAKDAGEKLFLENDATLQWEQKGKNEFSDLALSLDKWKNLVGGTASPDPGELESLAREVREKIEKCRSALPARGFDHLTPLRMINETIPTTLDVIKAELARQWQSRAGTPAFTGIVNRLGERPLEASIAPSVDAALKSSGGKYRKVWSNKRDALVDKLPRAERTALLKTFKTLDLGPALDVWKDQSDLLSKGKYDLRKMRESALNIAHASEKYISAVEATVTDNNVVKEFKDLLNGIQLQVRNEGGLFLKWVFPAEERA